MKRFQKVVLGGIALIALGAAVALAPVAGLAQDQTSSNSTGGAVTVPAYGSGWGAQDDRGQ